MTEAAKPTVGFIGVGNMGWPMAACLVRAGFTVLVNDSGREVANNFVQQIGGAAPDTRLARHLVERQALGACGQPTREFQEPAGLLVAHDPPT